jgi:hypothetical protein
MTAGIGAWLNRHHSGSRNGHNTALRWLVDGMEGIGRNWRNWEELEELGGIGRIGRKWKELGVQAKRKGVIMDDIFMAHGGIGLPVHSFYTLAWKPPTTA